MHDVALGAGQADVSQTRSSSLRTRVKDVVTRAADSTMERLLRHTTRAVPTLQEAWMRALVETNGLAHWADACLIAEDDVKTYVGVLNTSNRKPPLSSVSPATDTRLSAHAAFFRARVAVQCEQRRIWLLRGLQRFRKVSRVLSWRKQGQSARSSGHHAVLP
jgi:hypothetical protein